MMHPMFKGIGEMKVRRKTAVSYTVVTSYDEMLADVIKEGLEIYKLATVSWSIFPPELS